MPGGITDTERQNAKHCARVRQMHYCRSCAGSASLLVTPVCMNIQAAKFLVSASTISFGQLSLTTGASMQEGQERDTRSPVPNEEDKQHTRKNALPGTLKEKDKVTTNGFQLRHPLHCNHDVIDALANHQSLTELRRPGDRPRRLVSRPSPLVAGGPRAPPVAVSGLGR